MKKNGAPKHTGRETPMKVLEQWCCLTLIVSCVVPATAQTTFWQPSQLSVSSVTSLHAGQNHFLAVGSKSSGIYGSTDGGETFRSLMPFSYYPVTGLARTSNGNLFAALVNPFQSTDGGTTWLQCNNNPGPLYDLVAGSVAASGQNVLFAGGRPAGGAEVDQSTDQGTTWNQPFSMDGYSSDSMWIAILGINSNGIALAATRSSSHSAFRARVYGLIRSTNFGATWAAVPFTPASTPDIRCLGWASNGNAFAATRQSVIRSTDFGLSWSPVDGTPPTSDIRCIALNSRDHIYLGTGDAGVFYSIDSGSSWIQQNSGLTDTTINTLAVDPDGYLFVGTERTGLFRSTLSTTSVNAARIPPATPLLLRNYPNPFNPQTTIAFNIPLSGPTTLTVWNLLGQRVTTLINEDISAGAHSIQWTAQDLPSGIYICTLRSRNTFCVRKLILSR